MLSTYEIHVGRCQWRPYFLVTFNCMKIAGVYPPTGFVVVNIETLFISCDYQYSYSG